MNLKRFLSGFLFVLFTFIIFSLIGMFVSGLSGAGENQGLAGGAIVVGYGVMAGLGGIVLAFVLMRLLPWAVIAKVNIALSVSVLIIAGLLFYYISTRMEEIKQESMPKEVTSPAQDVVMTPTVLLSDVTSPMSMGFFTPDFYRGGTLYLYGKPTPGKSVTDQVPWDSVAFKVSDQHRYEITYAPPFLDPSHLKLDYEMLYFSLRSEGRDFAEIVVNETDGRTAYIDKHRGKIIYWEEFILNANTVELTDEFPQEFRVKPLDHAGKVTTSRKYDLLRPESIKGYWLEVTLLGPDFKDEGRAWIRWRDERNLWVRYSLLS